MGKLILWLFLAVLLLLVPAEAKRKTKKYNKEHQYNSGIVHPVLGENQPQLEEEDPDILEAVDPCEGKCRSGQICQLSEGVAMCVCIPSCPEELDPRRKVCSNLNTTWDSECAIHQMRCWCRNSDRKCAGDKEKLSHIHIDYYGECREHSQCTENQMADFPRRMKEWLFNIMRDSADREELSTHYLRMEREAENHVSKRWANAAIWKFCDLDTSNDRAISRHEIFPIRAPLIALEHCIAPFLDKCDADGNHRITLQEWASCLQIKEDEIEDQCDIVRDDDNEE